jgi:hypothetical protein
MSLKRKVPYTNIAKPTTCNHLNVSHPRPRETTQMKRVRQVSIVERAVAETERVTERPKKLNPLLYVLELTANQGRRNTHPILIMIKTLLTAIAL